MQLCHAKTEFQTQQRSCWLLSSAGEQGHGGGGAEMSKGEDKSRGQMKKQEERPADNNRSVRELCVEPTGARDQG